MEMNELAHVLRAARAITGESVFMIVGSQAILAQHPDAPAAMKMSMEVDILPRDRPDLSDLIEGALGAESHFHATFGYHADGIGEETAILPMGWEDRAFVLEGHPLLEGAVVICPEIHDLCASKLMAFREKDRSWVEAAVTAELADPATIARRLDGIGRDPGGTRGLASRWVKAMECQSSEP
ncbi:MAG: hypothetical protein F4X97_06285 [Boseongicola sp. SB0662_bin_57]|nr:hypothetical protein [Boseongicola sp. SB0662_bin_57]